LIAYCEGTSIIGTPFLLTRWIEGWPGSAPIPAHLDRPETSRLLAFSLIDALAQLHALDYQRVGLEGFGRPDGFLARQVDQWLELFRRHRTAGGINSRDLPDVPFIASWLRRVLPAQSAAALIHCDASFSNVIFCNDHPPRLAALIDWEIATIGDPLVDIGRALYPFPDERGIPGVSLMLDHSAGPTRQVLASRYAERTGVAVERLDFFMVLAMFKLAALIEPNYARHVTGSDPSGFSGRVAAFVPELLRGARSIIELQPQNIGTHTA
jgi:aminoglycoside phosphotransferase (APT) family kinase protein